MTASAFYDQKLPFQAMTASMWPFDQYQQFKNIDDGMAAGFHPFAFAQQLSSITMGQNCMSMTAGGPIREVSAPPKKKPPNPVPAELKTEALLLFSYYERRKRNNESARKSRESRRLKEDQNTRRLEILQMENQNLRYEVTRLRAELEQMRCLLTMNNTAQVNNLTQAY
ncbi:hypothetical protein WR25_03218 [Diploscapter pachys]|uniref:BZIP domain-containing protein n=1 Tax=Diploscapter pachys TaxID=2018661 RepID=A0A2A2JQA3_9BILA|nr:hypothetical protein WR25_03218 [Diploscapter pachys]